MKTRRKRRPKIRVTAEHIANNNRKDCESCAIALALHDSLGGDWSVWFDDAREDGNGDGIFRGGRRVKFTPRVKHLRSRLDEGEIVDPFEF